MTTITYRDNILAADQCLTAFETYGGKEPTSRSYIKKIRIISIDPHRRLAIATRGNAVDAVVIERLVIEAISKAAAEEKDGDDVFGWDAWDNWAIDVKGIKWESPDEEQGGVMLYRDLRSQVRLHVWDMHEPRFIMRVPKGEFVATGCDGPFAAAAMAAGADAIKAVWIASKYGVATAGPVNYVNAATMVLNTQRRNPLEE